MGKIVYVVFDEYSHDHLPKGAVDTNTIYRCEKRGDGNYKVETPSFVQGIVFNDTEGEEEFGYFKLREVTVEDIFDMDIDREEIEKVIEWEKGDNEDLFKLDFDISKIAGSIERVSDNSKNIVLSGTDALNDIAVNDPLYEECIMEFISYAAKSTWADVGVPIDQSMKENPVFGAPVNVYEVVRTLQEYMSTGKESLLLKSIDSIFTEIKRRKIS